LFSREVLVLRLEFALPLDRGPAIEQLARLS